MEEDGSPTDQGVVEELLNYRASIGLIFDCLRSIHLVQVQGLEPKLFGRFSIAALFQPPKGWHSVLASGQQVTAFKNAGDSVSVV